MVGFIVGFLTVLLSSVRSLPVLKGRSRQTNAQIVQLSEGIDNNLPKYPRVNGVLQQMKCEAKNESETVTSLSS